MAKPFSQGVIDQAWSKAGGRCECVENCHSRTRRCNRILDPQNKRVSETWEAHHINSNGEAIASNCKILCGECHKNTRSYGVS